MMMTGRWAAHKPQDLIEDVEMQRITFIDAELNTNCHFTCQVPLLSLPRSLLACRSNHFIAGSTLMCCTSIAVLGSYLTPSRY